MNAPAPLGVIANYNLLERLEPAGPGDLYRARDTRAGRTVVVRVLPAALTPDAAARRALIDRARGTTVLSHPNVITLFDFGEHEDRVYLVFEFLTGRSLRAEMAGRQMNIRRAVEIAIQIADAVADAHAGGFVHGGLSPETVTITAKGNAKIPAFELAARGGFEPADEAGLDGSAVVRLRDYDSPEEARGQPPDDRSDIYSVGAILYEMLTIRRPPHRGASAPSASNARVGKNLDEVVLKAVAPNPESRYQNVAAFAAELRGLAATLEHGAEDEEDYVEKRSISVGRVLVMTLVILLLVSAIVWWVMRS